MQKVTADRLGKVPFSVSITLSLMLLLALAWLTFSFYVVFGAHPSYSHMGIFKWVMAGLTFLSAAALLGLWFFLRMHFKPAWYLSVALLAAMTLAGIFDDVGWIDILVMLLSAVPLVLLVKDRRWYLRKMS